MIIGVDIDGVLADFNTGFIARVIEVTGRDLFPPRPFDIPTWNYPEHYGYTADEVSAVWADIKADCNFWASLPPYDETRRFLQALEQMQNYNEVYFVTARPGVDVKYQTEFWLRRNGFSGPTVLISSAKGLCARALKMDRYLDDRWENCVDAAQETKAFMLVRPWNRCGDPDSVGITEVTSVADFLAA